MEGSGQAELIGGVRPVEEALSSGKREVYRLVVARGRRGLESILRRAEEKRIPVEVSDRRRLDELYAGSHQGVVALVAPYPYWELADLVEQARRASGPPVILALDSLQDPVNLGTILRVAAAFGVEGVVVPRDRSCGLTPSVVKASAGALEHVAVSRVVNLSRALNELKREGFWIVGTSDRGPTRVDEFDWGRPVVVVLGGEGKGMRPLVEKSCDEVVAIPLPGPIRALNVAVAAAILCYEIIRQRRGVEKPS
jgi:23S rRNA (guanosine2251-2'-O)-methyltransferase